MTEHIVYNRDLGRSVVTETESGIRVKVLYTPDDIRGIDYRREIGNPGDEPFVRGIYPEMYRFRRWLDAFVVCYTDPKETNEVFKTCVASGLTGLRFVTDTPSATGLDPDHPLAKYSLGTGGVSGFSMNAYEQMFDGLPLEDVDYEGGNVSPAGSTFNYIFLVAMMEKRGLNISKLRGSFLNDPIHSFMVLDTKEFPYDLARKVNVDLIEFSVKSTPKFHPCVPSGYDLREAGATMIQELGFCVANALQYCQDVINTRGIRFDDFPRQAISTGGSMDFFENVCKFRALRRIWARVAKEKLGATSSRARSCLIAMEVCASIGTAQKPVNNIVRQAIVMLSAVLGGVQSINPTGFAEYYGLPSEENRIVELDTSHIIFDEARLPLTVDPLGGSYYVEWLTAEIERRVNELLNEIERRGGAWRALESGWLREELGRSALNREMKRNSGEDIVVGVNAYQGPDGPLSKAVIEDAFKVKPTEDRFKAIDQVKLLRATRSANRVKACLKELYRVAKERKNIVRPLIEASKVYATVGEMVGMLRLGYNYSYDPYEIIEVPDFLRELA
jgi:methylmalonyl-CoA mutase N-terminal domain/subunit